MAQNRKTKIQLTDEFQLLLPIIVWIIIGKRRNYKLLAVLLLIRDITSQSYPLSKRERVILIQYLPPEINQNEKKTFIHETIFSDPKLCTPLCIFLASWLGGGGMYDSRCDPDKKGIKNTTTKIGPLTVMCCTRLVNSVTDCYKSISTVYIMTF